MDVLASESAPLLEVAQEFNGGSTPAQEVMTSRTMDYDTGGYLQYKTSVSNTYYLRSCVLGGQAVAELSETGAGRAIFVSKETILTDAGARVGHGVGKDLAQMYSFAVLMPTVMRAFYLAARVYDRR